MTTFKAGDTGRTRDGREYVILEVRENHVWAAIRKFSGEWMCRTFLKSGHRFSPHNTSPLDLLPPKETT